VNGQLRGQWVADDILPPAAPDLHPDGETSTRVTFSNIRVKPGDVLNLRGASDGTEPAPIDYIEITPSANLSRP
jgi:alpha-glucuronidase